MTTNNKVWLAALGAVLFLAQVLSAAPSADQAALRALDQDYQRAFLASDVARYRQMLSDDFRAVLADGRVIDRPEFLREAAQPPRVSGFWRQDPLIRLYGDTAVVITRIGYRRPDGAAVQTRYVSVYLRRDGRWRMISVQFTRVT